MCTEWAGLMLCVVGSIWRSCALSYRRTQSCRQRAGHMALPVLLCHPRQAGRMVSVLRLGHLDVAGGGERSWIRLHRSRLGLRSRTRRWRRRLWCLIVIRHCWRFLWMSRGLICGQTGLRYPLRSRWLSLPYMSSNSGGGFA